MGSQVHNRDSGTTVGILKRGAQLFCRSWVLVLGVVGLHDGSEESRRFKAEIGEFSPDDWSKQHLAPPITVCVKIP